MQSLVSHFLSVLAAAPSRALTATVVGRVVHAFQEAEERCSLAYPAKFDAKGLHLDKEVLDVDNLVPDERLQEDAHQAHQSALGRLVLAAEMLLRETRASAPRRGANANRGRGLT